ncbi:hypothetical protein B7760_05094 [Burkholderia glumae]|uniref:phage tail tape measure protein n=1 Tax=Burkholderia glumae TaxID=337 RepID=UPI00157B323F|nr:phage tail tape measure protein [Burkholderia glumae]MCR1769585.1 phage tail tape measure protein [Burkholderia glumae]QKM51029.1 hypothetical protein B7760_05094 [Burkholderia glumae]
MSNMVLRYVITLTSDLKRRAAENARALEQASQRQTKALTDVDRAAQKTEKTLEQVSSKTNAARPEGSARRMAAALASVANATQRATTALSQMGGRSSLDRMNAYLASVSRRIDDVRRNAERAAHVVGRIGQTGAAVVGGAVAVGTAAAATLQRPMSFDERLAHLSNFAYGQKTPAQRILEIGNLEDTINAAVRYGGGSRDTALQALGAVMASGSVEINDAKSMLPDLLKGATACDADVTEIAQVEVAGMRNFGLSKDDMNKVISKMVVAGHEGRFNIKNMAPYLPDLMASSNDKLGMRGMGDYEKLLSYAQASAITSGTADAAGIGLKNLILKINSDDTKNGFKKMGYDLPKSLARARERGFDGIMAFADFANQIVGKDKNYVELRKKASSETGDQQRETYRAMAAILQGSAIGKIINDPQALMALVGITANPDSLKKVQEQIHADNGEAVQSNFRVVSSRAAFKAQQIANETDMARSHVFEQIDGPLKTVLDAVTQLARVMPGATTAVTAFALTAAVVTAAGVGGVPARCLLSRGPRGTPGVPGGASGLGGVGSGPIPVYVVNKIPGWTAPTPGGAAGGAPGAATGGARRGLFGRLGGAAPWLVTAGLAAYDLLPTLLDSSKTPTEKANAAGRTAAGVAGGWAGAQAGIALGAFGGPFAPITVPLGGMLGGAVGFLGAQWAGDQLTSVMSRPPSQRASETRASDGSTAQVPQELLDRISILRTQPAYLINPMLQPSTALAIMDHIQAESQKVEVGNGTLNVNVAVRDERIMTTATVTQQPFALRVDAGSTNPGGF